MPGWGQRGCLLWHFATVRCDAPIGSLSEVRRTYCGRIGLARSRVPSRRQIASACGHRRGLCRAAELGRDRTSSGRPDCDRDVAGADRTVHARELSRNRNARACARTARPGRSARPLRGLRARRPGAAEPAPLVAAPPRRPPDASPTDRNGRGLVGQEPLSRCQARAWHRSAEPRWNGCPRPDQARWALAAVPGT